MKKFVLCTLALAMTSPVFAGLVHVTEEVVGEITNANAMSSARVYISEKVKIVRESDEQKSSEVDTHVSRVVKKNVLKEEIGKKIRGKIIAIEGTNYFQDGESQADIRSRLKTIYVSFDQSCDKKECAYKFTKQGNFYGGSWYGASNWYFHFSDDAFCLAGVPAVKDMKIKSMKIGRLFGDQALSDQGYLAYITFSGNSVRLLIDLEELRLTNIEKIKHQGF